jgi:threonine synthase
LRYVSTRGEAPALGFRDAILAGLARDGGLYVPETWPELSRKELADLAGLPYAEVAARIIGLFAGNEIDPAALRRMTGEAYATFRHPAVAPLVQIGDNHFLLELFHGPTLAFKDVAMQLLARLMDHVLAERGERATIVGATSGDTGGAAIEAFRGRDRVDVAILFPKGRVSDVQRRQMTTSREANVQAIAVEGSFDDAQALLKAMFADARFRDSVSLTAVNSINWGRIVAQAVYYVTAAVALGAPHRPVSFTVPTGNFGNVFAGRVAAAMGLPVTRLVVATNENDILARFFACGRYERGSVVPTTSPSMDIQVASNFERLLLELEGGDAERTRGRMQGFAQSGGFALGGRLPELFAGGSANQAEVAATIAATLRASGELVDPHTAVGLAVAARNEPEAGIPMVTLATAHPAKFPDAVEKATGIRPALPPHLAELLDRPEQFVELPNDLAVVEQYVRSATRR